VYNLKYYFSFLATLLWKVQLFEKISQALLAYGWAGVFVIALLDSAFVPMPSGPDLLLILGVSLNGSTSAVVSYVIAATIGSTIGCTLLYLMARRAGQIALKPVSLERREYIQGMLGRYDALAIVVASLMPPPFPFKAFILSAGVFKFKLGRMIVALLFGRTIRYLILALLALYFGESTIGMIKKYGPQLLIVIIAAGALLLAIRYFGARRASVGEGQ
jgi:membrane protein YqaA with SNARE-associated domain